MKELLQEDKDVVFYNSTCPKPQKHLQVSFALDGIGHLDKAHPLSLC